MALPLPPSYSQPIPNNPFYSPEKANVYTPSGTLTLGSGLGVIYNTGELIALGDGSGTVQQVATGTGLTGGPITVTGTIALAPLSPSSAGAYTNPTALDVDAYGRITSVTNGDPKVPVAAYSGTGVVLAGTGVGSYASLAAGALNQILVADPFAPMGVKWAYPAPNGIVQITGTLPVFINNPSGPVVDVAVAIASLTSSGVVQLNNSVASDSTTQAATANAVKTAYDLAAAAVPNSAFNAKGDIIVGTGNDTYGNFPSGTDGQIIVADSAEVFGVKWVDNTPDGVLGVTGAAPVTVDNTDPANPIIGIDSASTTAAGAVQLSDDTNSTSTTEAATINAVRVIGDVAFGAQGTADQAVLDAAAAQATADAAMPKAGGSFSGNVDFEVGAGFLSGSSTEFAAGSILDLNSTTNVQGDFTVSGAGGFGVSGTSGDFINGAVFTLDSTSSAFLDGTFTFGNTSVTTVKGGFAFEGVVDISNELLFTGDVGTAGYILQSNGAGLAPTWVANAADGVQGVTGTAPISVDNTDPVNPIIGINAASTASSGAVQLSDDTNSTSTTEAATINAVRVIGDVAFGAQGTADQAILDAAAAQATADAALPKAGGTMTGNLLFTGGAGIDVGIGDFLSNGQVNVDNTLTLGASSYASVTGIFSFNSGASLEVEPTATVSINGPTTFFVTPSYLGGANIGPADKVTYDNTTSGLAATEVQSAIDELVSAGPTIVAAPATSADPGVLGQVAFGGVFFYWYDGAQWLRTTGSTF